MGGEVSMRRFVPVAAILILLHAVPARAFQEEAMMGEISRLRGRVVFLEEQLKQRDEMLAGMGKDIRSLADALGDVKERLGPAPLGGPFLQSPPTPSDSVGIAKQIVLQPRLEVDSALRHDLVSLKLKRIETAGVRLVAEFELGVDVIGVDLPIDQSGGLYSLEWSTSEGFNYNLVLRDSATGRSAALVQVKQLQNFGRIVFVGYKLD
jgi:hypothetical protein